MSVNILDTIVAHKKLEVVQQKQKISIAELEKMPLFQKQAYSLVHSVKDADKTGIIAEFKRKSPSKGIINDQAQVANVTSAYASFGASGISVLTDQDFFGGHLDDLSIAVQNTIPVLRKEFIIDEFQIIEAKAYGASVILLIAACLSVSEVKQFAQLAKSIGLEVLLEIHNEQELDHICVDVDLVGINNRSLQSFEVNIEHSLKLKDKLPFEKLSVAESGIYDVETFKLLKKEGFDAFLMGEYFMKQSNPAKAFEDFVNLIKQ
jgi:indole-3-glycerol phosphate synthase